MDIITVNNQQVIKCVHCNGSGVCYIYSEDLYVEKLIAGTMRKGWVLACSKCGEGVFHPGWPGFFGRTAPTKNQLNRPVCGVCGGKGHVVV